MSMRLPSCACMRYQACLKTMGAFSGRRGNYSKVWRVQKHGRIPACKWIPPFWSSFSTEHTRRVLLGIATIHQVSLSRNFNENSTSVVEILEGVCAGVSVVHEIKAVLVEMSYIIWWKVILMLRHARLSAACEAVVRHKLFLVNSESNFIVLAEISEWGRTSICKNCTGRSRAMLCVFCFVSVAGNTVSWIKLSGCLIHPDPTRPVVLVTELSMVREC